jgi:hypothetical protein
MLMDRQHYSWVFVGVAITLACAIVAALAVGREAERPGTTQA